MWRDIFLDNRAEVLPLIEALGKRMRERCARRSPPATRTGIEKLLAAGKAAAIGSCRASGDAAGRGFGVLAASARCWRRHAPSSRGRRPRAGRGPAARPPTTAICGTWRPATPTSLADVDLGGAAGVALVAGADERRDLAASARSAAAGSATTSSPRASGCWWSGARPAAAPHTLTIARGTLRPGASRRRVRRGDAGRGRRRSWRDSPLWEGSGRAVALVTPRTLAQGEPERRARPPSTPPGALVPDARGGPLGELRRSLDADRNPPAAVRSRSTVTDGMRARAAGVIDLPPEAAPGRRRASISATTSNLDGVALFDRRARGGGRGVDLERGGAHLRPAADGRAARARPDPRRADRWRRGDAGARPPPHPGADRREGLAEKLLAVLQAGRAGARTVRSGPAATVVVKRA